jgi:hypothetical protein
MTLHSGLPTAGLLAFILAASASAQTPDGYRKLTDKQAAQELMIYAQCLTKWRGDRARALALAPYGSPEQANAANNLTRSVDDDCIRSGFDTVRMQVRPDVLAGAVATALLMRDYPDLPAVIDRTKVDVEAERARAASLSVAERFGRCIAWGDPAGVQALLKAESGSSAERQAIAALNEDMGMCLQEGNTLRLSRTFVRDVAAIATYRLAQLLRPRAAGAQGG